MITTLIEGLFIKMPMGLGKSLLDLTRKMARRNPLCGILGTLVFLGICSAIGVAASGAVIDALKKSPLRYAGFYTVLAVYAAYLLISLPVFYLFAYVKAGRLTRGLTIQKKARFTARQMKASRNGALTDEVFLGRSMWSRKSSYLSTEMRKMHCHIVGSTGSGKTDSLVLPLFVQDIERGRGAIIMDAKGDRETLNKILYHVKRAGRDQDFLFFSLAYPERSNTYNPLLRGNPTELKDKIVSANIWTEEFYKSKAEEALLLLMKCLSDVGENITFHKLYELLTDKDRFVALSKRVKNAHIQDVMESVLKRFSSFQDELSGLVALLGLIAESEFAHLLTDAKPQIDLLSAYQKKQIVYFQLNTQGYEETARRFGRIILQDLKTISNHIQAYMPEKERFFFPVYVDEFSNFAYEAFIEFLNKARGAHFGITMAHQSLGDLEKTGSYFVKQVMENCNIKIIMRQDDPHSIETYSRISGTEKALKDTVQTQDDFFTQSPTGMGTVRVVDEFRLNPNMIRELGRGEAAVIIKQPFLVDVLQLDYVGDVPQEVMSINPTKGGIWLQ
jgi:type IV secretory pathway TraG/TraD family ATPase VirD4